MRIALIADSHFDETSRFEECVRIHDWICEDLRLARDVDLVLHAGDLFERKSTPAERDAVAAWLQELADIAPVVMVRGNHDAPGDLKLFERLETHWPIRVAETAEVVFEGGAAVACLPWPTRSTLAADVRSSALVEDDAREALRSVLRGLGQEMGPRPKSRRHIAGSNARPRILLAHAMVRGSKTSTGQPLVGCPFELALEDLALAGADVVALGHVHMPQEWPKGPVVYPGSPRRTAFGEVESKGYVLLDLNLERDHARVVWERVETPCAPMLLVTGEMETLDGERVLAVGSRDEPIGDALDDLEGAEIRLRYTTPAEERDLAARLAANFRSDWLERGASCVVLEPQVTTSTRARAPEIAAARTLDEKLVELWRARGDEPEGDFRGRLLAGAHDLESA